MPPQRSATAIALLAMACTSRAPEPAEPDLALIRTELDSLWASYSAAATAENIESLARLYSDSLHLVELGLPTLRGKPEWRGVVTEIFGAVRIVESTVRPELTELLGRDVLQTGEYRDVVQPAGEPARAIYGRFSAVFRRNDAGAWQLYRLIGFADSTVVESLPTIQDDRRR
jgi:ketosteroid isomerase-like protein